MQTGALERFPDIRYILCHGGGSVPFLAWRIAMGQFEEAKNIMQDRGLYDCTMIHIKTDKEIEVLKRLYFDTAQQGAPLMKAVQELVSQAHILLGSNFAWTSEPATPVLIKELEAYDGFDEQALEEIERRGTSVSGISSR